MDALETRSAIPADADAVADYHHRCFIKTYASHLLAGEFGAPDQAGTRRELHDRFLPESDCDTRVVVVDDVPMTTAAVFCRPTTHGERSTAIATGPTFRTGTFGSGPLACTGAP